MEKEFCRKCKRAINKGTFGFGMERYIEFEDGVYCEKCAKVEIDKRRKQ